MAKASVKAGSTSWVSEIFIQDSSSTTGAGKTGLRPDTASLTAYYKRNNGTAAVSISLGTITTLGTFVSGGFKEVDSTNMPGLYEFDPPDASIADGATSVVYLLKGATNMAPVVLEAELVHVNNQDSVRYGLTALPNAAAEASGGLYTRGTGAGQLNQSANGQVDTNVARWLNTAVTAATAGIPDTNAKNINNVATTSVTTINANIGTTQPTNFTGTGASALVKSDMVDVAGAAVSTSTAQIGVNVVNFGGSAGTFASGRPEVDVSSTSRTLIGSATWDQTLASHLASGSTGAALNAAGAAGDPWSTTIPGAYGAGTAGYIVGTNVDALISSRLAPTVASRTLDVSATGEAGIDWANIGSPTATVNLSATTVKTATDVATQASDIQSRLPAALTGGRMDSSVGAYQTGLTPLQPTTAGRTLDVSATGEAGIDWANIGAPTTSVTLSATTISAVSGSVGSVTGAVGSVTGNVGGQVIGSVASVTGAVGSVTGNVGGNVTGTVGSVIGSVGSVAGNVTGSVGSLATQAKQDVKDQVQNTLGSTTWTLPGQVSPSATPTAVEMQAYVYKSFRNKITQTSTTFQLLADDSVTVDQKATVADDGTTFSRTKIVSGP